MEYEQIYCIHYWWFIIGGKWIKPTHNILKW